MMNLSASISSCTAHKWQEKTIIKNGKPRRVVYDEKQTTTYSLFDDSNEAIRLKLGALFVLCLTLAFPARLGSRVIHVVAGTWAFAGYEKAQIIWMQKALRKNPDRSLWKYRLTIIQQVGRELVDHIIKCVTLPLCFIALLFACLYGQIFPLDGRWMFGTVEDLWKISWPKNGCEDSDWFSITNYLAFCMQSKEVWDRENLYRFSSSYDPKHPSGVVQQLKQYERWGFFALNQSLLDKADPLLLKDLLAKCQALEALLKKDPSSLSATLADARKRIEKATEAIWLP